MNIKSAAVLSLGIITSYSLYYKDQKLNILFNQEPIKMEGSPLYKVVKIEGKDLGCVAIKDIKKGTLILQEKPQCVPIIDDLGSIITSFNQMTKNHQEEFLKLHDRFGNFEILNEYEKQRQIYLEQWIEANAEFLNENMMGIYDERGKVGHNET